MSAFFLSYYIYTRRARGKKTLGACESEWIARSVFSRSRYTRRKGEEREKEREREKGRTHAGPGARDRGAFRDRGGSKFLIPILSAVPSVSPSLLSRRAPRCERKTASARERERERASLEYFLLGGKKKRGEPKEQKKKKKKEGKEHRARRSRAVSLRRVGLSVATFKFTRRIF